MAKLVIFDCDSTLSGIEGIDELGRMQGEEIFSQVEEMTRSAMEGKIMMEEVFTRRMELIRPGLAELQAIAQSYHEHIEPHLTAVLPQLREQGWDLAVVSGGLLPAVEPFSKDLGIDAVMAVPVEFDAEGNYQSFNPQYPTAVTNGKRDCAAELKEKFGAELSVMVGDGISDLETKGTVDYVVGFGGFAVRERVKNESDAWLTSLETLPEVLAQWSK